MNRVSFYHFTSIQTSKSIRELKLVVRNIVVSFSYIYAFHYRCYVSPLCGRSHKIVSFQAQQYLLVISYLHNHI